MKLEVETAVALAGTPDLAEGDDALPSKCKPDWNKS
jgi:hypothetical protein